MLYYLFDYLDRHYNLIGAGVFQYISFRSGMAAVLSLVITVLFGKQLIQFLKNRQAKESIRDLGLDGQLQKAGTPTMGGLIMIGAILVPTLLFAKLNNIYVILLITTTVWLGVLGLLDDYIKVYKKNKKGLLGWFKIIGQVGLGCIVGLTLYFHKDVKIRRQLDTVPSTEQFSSEEGQRQGTTYAYEDIKSTKTTIPFLKNNELDYSTLLPVSYRDYTWILYAIVVILVVTSVSNGTNLTDGMDGLAAGSSAIVGLTLGIFAYLSGRVDFSSYLNIMYIPNLGELVIFCTAFVGACLGFLWYNSFPAQVFMGDTGSLALGGVIAVLALAARKELLVPLFCGVLLIESVSVIMQVYYFKYTRRRYGEGRRIFLMAPLHHHYQKMGINESKIVTRFWIVGILLAILSLATLKLR